MKKDENKEMKFEEALDRLESIINNLQDGDMSLDESLGAFQEGVGLVRACQSKLDSAEAKINMLIKDENGKETQITHGNFINFLTS